MYYALAVADLIGWDGDRGELLTHVLTHDFDELITGDIVAPVKHQTVDAETLRTFAMTRLARQIPYAADLIMKSETSPRKSEIAAILKAADALDALFFACTERNMGNSIIGARIPSCLDRLRQSWHHLPCDEETRHSTYVRTVYPAYLAHNSPTNYDIAT